MHATNKQKQTEGGGKATDTEAQGDERRDVREEKKKKGGNEQTNQQPTKEKRWNTNYCGREMNLGVCVQERDRERERGKNERERRTGDRQMQDLATGTTDPLLLLGRHDV